MFRRNPLIDFGLKDISQMAQQLAGKLSISGVQPKLSVKWDKKKNQLVSVAEGGEYILKPQTAPFPDLPENEQCCMDIAEALGIAVPPHALLPLKDGSLAYVVKRFDREKGQKIHQEDFAQILSKTDKYQGSIEQIGKKLKGISSMPGYDVQLLFERVVLNFLLGNGDAHLKNFSMTYKTPEDIRLSPAYDIVCSKLVLPDEEDSALTINGKKNDLEREDFETLADHFNIPQKVRYEKFSGKRDLAIQFVRHSKLDSRSQKIFLSIIEERFRRLSLESTWGT